MKKTNRWIAKNFGDLVDLYGGRYVAVSGERVVAVGARPDSVERKARSTEGKGALAVLRVPAAIEIGQERFAAFGQQSSLWIVKADDEKRLIESMRHNPAVTIWAVAEDGSQNKYAYSLNGFTQALDRVA